MMKLGKHKLIILILMVIICLILQVPVQSQADNKPDDVEIPQSIYTGLHHYQTLIVFKYRQRKVLISLSRQADVSSVGKKGYVLGEDDDWDYFYTNTLFSQ